MGNCAIGIVYESPVWIAKEFRKRSSHVNAKKAPGKAAPFHHGDYFKKKSFSHKRSPPHMRRKKPFRIYNMKYEFKAFNQPE